MLIRGGLLLAGLSPLGDSAGDGAEGIDGAFVMKLSGVVIGRACSIGVSAADLSGEQAASAAKTANAKTAMSFVGDNRRLFLRLIKTSSHKCVHGSIILIQSVFLLLLVCSLTVAARVL
jgi:hypothetical protein